jgi:hypothetical protein
MNMEECGDVPQTYNMHVKMVNEFTEDRRKFVSRLGKGF